MLIPFTSASFTNISGLAVADGADVEVRLESNGALAALFDDREGTTPLTNPFNADIHGRFAFYVAGVLDGYSVEVTKDAQSHILHHQLTSTAAAIIFEQLGTGAVSQSLEEKIRRGVPVEPQDFMTEAQKGDVAALTFGENVTTPLLNFFNFCIANNLRGYIGPGGYLITKGVLAFDSGHVDKAWPMIETAGYGAVEFRATASTNAPFISITNGTASSAVGEFWNGGKLGGITFQDTSGAAAANAHGLVLGGMDSTTFGQMRGLSLRGDLIHIEEKLFGGTNPDPYHIAWCVFEGAFADGCVGKTLNNQNYVGLVGCDVGPLSAYNSISGTGGVLCGFGAENRFGFWTAGSCAGLMIDDRITSTGGPSHGITAQGGELDNVENAIRINTLKNSDLGIIRIVHRYQTAPNADAEYWPNTALDIAPSTPNVNDVTINMVNRLDAGGTEGALGEFINFNSAGGNIRGVDITIRIDDQAGFGIPDADLYTGLTNDARIRLRRGGDIVFDNFRTPKAIARVNAAQDIPTSAGICIFESEELDNYGAYDTATGEFTCPTPGIYRVLAQISKNGGAAGDRYILTIEQGVATVATKYGYAATTGIESYTIERMLVCVDGEVLRVRSVTNNGSPVPMQPGADFTFLQIALIEGR